MSEPIDFEALRAPFELHNLTWMLTPGTLTKNGSVITAKCLAYVTSRAVQERLDAVCTPAGWRNEFVAAPNAGERDASLCGISILINGEWVTKWDGSENTDIEAVKGGLSGAMKRAGAMWGIGRYLYYLPEAWAIVSPNGRYWYGGQAKLKGKKDREYVSFNWSPPEVPDWALPSGGGAPPQDVINPQTGEVVNSEILCPVCDSPCFDNREGKEGTNVVSNRKPDLVCSAPGCPEKWHVYIMTWQHDLLELLMMIYNNEKIDAEEQDKGEKLIHTQNAKMMTRLDKRLRELAAELAEAPL